MVKNAPRLRQRSDATAPPLSKCGPDVPPASRRSRCAVSKRTEQSFAPSRSRKALEVGRASKGIRRSYRRMSRQVEAQRATRRPPTQRGRAIARDGSLASWGATAPNRRTAAEGITAEWSGMVVVAAGSVRHISNIPRAAPEVMSRRRAPWKRAKLRGAHEPPAEAR